MESDMTDDDHCRAQTALTVTILWLNPRQAGFSYAHDPTPRQINVEELHKIPENHCSHSDPEIASPGPRRPIRTRSACAVDRVPYRSPTPRHDHHGKLHRPPA